MTNTLRACMQRLMFVSAVVLILMPIRGWAQFVSIPELTGPVVDTTGILEGQASVIEKKLWDIKAEKGSEVALLIVSTTQPETIEQFSIRVVDQWKLGRKGIDDGALLLVALGDRTVRIEVGRGLEGDIPDVKAHRIIQEQILPRFRQGNIPEGIEAGIDSIVGLVRGMELPPPVPADNGGFARDIPLDVLLPIFLASWVFGSAFVKPFGPIVAALIGSLLGFSVTSLIFSVVYGFVVAIVIAVCVFFFGGLYSTAAKIGSGGGPRSRGSGGSSSRGGSFGSGGGFGGGGASGRW